MSLIFPEQSFANGRQAASCWLRQKTPTKYRLRQRAITYQLYSSDLRPHTACLAKARPCSAEAILQLAPPYSALPSTGLTCRIPQGHDPVVQKTHRCIKTPLKALAGTSASHTGRKYDYSLRQADPVDTFFTWLTAKSYHLYLYSPAGQSLSKLTSSNATAKDKLLLSDSDYFYPSPDKARDISLKFPFWAAFFHNQAAIQPMKAASDKQPLSTGTKSVPQIVAQIQLIFILLPLPYYCRGKI